MLALRLSMRTKLLRGSDMTTVSDKAIASVIADVSMFDKLAKNPLLELWAGKNDSEIDELIKSIAAMTDLIKTNRAKFTAQQLEDLGNNVEDLLNAIDEAIEEFQ